MVKKIIIIVILVLCLSSISFANRDYLVGFSLEYNSSSNSFSLLDISNSVGYKPKNYGDDFSLFLLDENTNLIDSINFSLPTSLYAPLIDLETGETIAVKDNIIKQMNLYLLYLPTISKLKIVDNSNGEVLLEEDISLQISEIEYTTIDHIMIDERVKDIGTAKKILASGYYDTKGLPTYESNTISENKPILVPQGSENIKNDSLVEQNKTIPIKENNTINNERTIINENNEKTNKIENELIIEEENKLDAISKENKSTKNIINIILILIVVSSLVLIYFIHSKNL